MNIKLKLSLQFSTIVISLLIFFAGLVYYLSYQTHINKYRDNLEEFAKNTAILLIDVVEVDSVLLKKIHRSTIWGERDEIILTDSAFRILYSNKLEYLSPEVLKKKLTSSTISYYTLGDKDGIFYRHKFKNRTYYVCAAGYDRIRHVNLSQLRETLFWSIISSVILSVFLSYIFSRRAISPISRLIGSIKNINSLRLNARLEEGNRKDEIAQLAMTFNSMLSDLEVAFRNQEEFISNASHELRTPFSIMLIESEYLLSKDRTNEEYKEHLQRLTDDIRKLNHLVNSLLELANLNRNKELMLVELRLDEIVFESIRQVKQRYPQRRIVSKIEYPDEKSDLLITGHSGLLHIAFNNLIENACKFSDNDILVDFRITDKEILVTISDTGIGIPNDQLNKVFNAFARGSNARYKSGFGIGLSLVHKIFEIHRVPYNVESLEHEGTRVSMTFRRI